VTKDKTVETLMEQLAYSEKAQLLKVEKEVKFTIGQLGAKRKRDLKKVGGGVYATSDSKGNEIMVLVEFKMDATTEEEVPCVVYVDAKGKNKCEELAAFLSSK
jgi:hypothetical protein